jgi:cysteine synthase B
VDAAGRLAADRSAADECLLVAAIGDTPLVEITDAATLPRGVRLFAKLESCNPGGSIKDRSVARMLSAALRSGALTDGRRVLDSSSGNAGIAYAMVGAALGVPVTLVVPGNASAERLDRIRAHGAELILTDPLEGYDFTVLTARRLADEQPEHYLYCDQYGNAENWLAHYHGTGAELLAQLLPLIGGAPDAFVCGIGTGGTLTGVGRRLREARDDVRLVVVAPETFPGIEGLKPLGSPEDLVPDILDESLIDVRIPVTSEQAREATRRLARHGLFVGPSSGANLVAAEAIAAREELRTLATVLPDTGERYVSTGLWS